MTTAQNPTIVTFAVDGMTCKSCVRRVDEFLKEKFDLTNHQIDLPGKKLTVLLDEAVSPEAIAQAMNQAGYPVTRL